MLIARNKKQTHIAQQRATKTRKDASGVINKISKRDLLILGASLYWAEGYKKPIIKDNRILTHHAVSLTNADPLLIKLFLRFLTEYCEVPNDKIRGNLRVFEHQNKSNLLDYWHKETNLNKINIVNYKKSRLSQGIRPFNTLPFGVFQVVVGNTQLYHKIMGYIEGIKKIV